MSDKRTQTPSISGPKVLATIIPVNNAKNKIKMSL